MEREEKTSRTDVELEETLYSSLNIGSFLERKRKERDLEQKQEKKEPKKEVVKVTPLVKDEPKKEVVTKKIVTAIEPEEKKEPRIVPKVEQPKKVVPKVEPSKKEEPTKNIHEMIQKRREEILKREALKNASKENPKKEEKKEIPKVEVKKETLKEEVKKEEPKKEIIKEVKKKEQPKEEPKQEKIKEENKIESKQASSKKEESKKEVKEEKAEEKIVEETKKPEKKESKKAKKEEKKKNKKSKKASDKLGKGLIIGVVICLIMDLFACTGLFLTYGPVSYFRDLLITSAMTTMSHKYLARTFYDEATIQKVIERNIVKEINEDTNVNDINFADAEDTGEYASIYEEQILKRDKDQVYKVIDVSEGNYTGYLVAIYDASRVKLVGATSMGYGGAIVTDIAKRNNAKVAMNASGYTDGGSKGSVAIGTVIQDGNIVHTGGATGYGGGIAGFNKDHVLVLTRESAESAVNNGMVDAVEFGPFLIVNGKEAEIQGNGGWGIAPRTVLAQRKDGIVLFLVVDGRNGIRNLGIDMKGLIKILKQYNAHNAVNLDGGGSSTLAIEGKLTNCPSNGGCGERYVPNAWIVK